MVREVCEITTKQSIMALQNQKKHFLEKKRLLQPTKENNDYTNIGRILDKDQAISKLEEQLAELEKEKVSRFARFFSGKLREKNKERKKVISSLSKLYDIKISYIEARIKSENEKLLLINESYAKIQKIINDFATNNPDIPTNTIFDVLDKSDSEKSTELKELLYNFPSFEFEECFELIQKNNIEPVLGYIDLFRLEPPIKRKGLNDLNDLIAIHKTDYMPSDDEIKSNRVAKATSERNCYNR